VVFLLAASGVLLAQQPPVDPQTAPTSNGGWRQMTDPAPAAASSQDQSPAVDAQDPSQPVARDGFGQAQPQQPAARPPAAQAPRPAYGLPPQVTLKQGTLVTLRINQQLASNHNAAGDTFTGSLTQPVVVDGIVVAQRGQMVTGRVVEADKVKGVSRLGIQLTGLTLADGSQAAVQTQLVSRQGLIMPGRQREDGVITTAPAGGSAPAAPAAGGTGALAVLATHGHPSVIYPETTLTFQTESAVTINTGNSTGAFRYVGPDDYPKTQITQQVPARPAYGYGYAAGYPYPYYPYYYPYWGPYWGGGVFIGGGFGFRGGFRR
jgi:hypothetical protein